MSDKIHVIINPASGHREPILNTLNTVFRNYTRKWEAHITHQAGDATDIAKTLAAEGVQVIAAYGGDGTLMEVVNGMVGSDIPLAILPGGTGNAMAFELDVPRQLQLAAELICQEHQIRAIDVAQTDNRHFMLRCYTGLNPAYQASREMKDQYGLLAYAMATFQTMTDPQYSTYQLTIDGQKHEMEGMVCLITNASSIGGFDFQLTPMIRPDDGLLDLFMINIEANSLLSIAGSILGSGEPLTPMQGREIIVEADPPQNVSFDGEPGGQTPLTIKVVPNAVKVIVPPA